MTSSAPRPSALQMALLWETRLSEQSVSSQSNAKPRFPIFTPPISPSSENASLPSTPRRTRNHASTSKPPVAPILTPSLHNPDAQLLTLAHPMLEASSPVSSFHSSAPSSPPTQNFSHLHNFSAQMEQLHRDLARCDQRMNKLERRFRTISARMRNVRVYNLH